MSAEWQLVERLAEQLRGDLPDPLDVRALAHAHGVGVMDVALHESGRLTGAPGGRAALLNKAEPEVRRRFTLAHELCHVALLDSKVGGSLARQAGEAFRSEEALCDAVAGAMLMPHDEVRGLRDRPRTFTTLATLIERFQVSWSAALVRMVDVCRWDRCLLEATLEADRWTLSAQAAVPSTATRLRLGADAHWSIQAAPAGAKALALTVELDRRPVDVVGEIRREPGRALLLLPTSALHHRSAPRRK